MKPENPKQLGKITIEKILEPNILQKKKKI